MSNQMKIGLTFVGVGAIAVIALIYFAITSNSQSGTVDPVPKQMTPGARAKKH